jgi:hypothetical protein
VSWMVKILAARVELKVEKLIPLKVWAEITYMFNNIFLLNDIK